MAPVELLGKANVRCVGMQYVGRWDTNDAVNDFLETLASNAVCGEYGSVALRGAPNENDATAVEAFETKSRARLGFIQRDAARLLFPHLSGVSRIVVECRITHCLRGSPGCACVGIHFSAEPRDAAARSTIALLEKQLHRITYGPRQWRKNLSA